MGTSKLIIPEAKIAWFKVAQYSKRKQDTIQNMYSNTKKYIDTTGLHMHTK